MAKKPNLPKGISTYITRDKDVRYRVRIFASGKQWAVGSYDSLQHARKALDIEKGLLASGQWTPPPQRKKKETDRAALESSKRLTVKEWSNQWLDKQRGLVETGRLSEGTVVTRTSLLKQNVLPVIGDLPLSQVAPSDIEGLVSALSAKPAKRAPGARRNGSVANVVSLLKTLFNAAISEGAGGLEASPVKIPTPSTTRIQRVADGSDYATPHEVAELALGMPERLRLAVLLGSWCGLRQGEVLGLKREDFIAQDGREFAQLKIERQWNSKTRPPAFTDPKSGSLRRIAIPSSLIPDIIHHFDKYVDSGRESLLFPGQNRSQPIGHTTFNKAWKKVRDQVKPGFRFHDLRATGLTEYARSGATLKDIMERGGHSDATTAMRYQRMAEDQDRKNTAVMDTRVVPLSTLGEQ